MEPYEVVALVLFTATNPLFARNFGAQRIWDVCWCAAAPYAGILLVNAILPYEYPYPRLNYVAPAVICAVLLLALSIYKAFSASAIRREIDSFIERRPSLLAVVLAYGGLLLLLFEFIINPSVRFTDDLQSNRDLMNETSIIGTVGKILSGAALFCLHVAISEMLNRKRRSGRGFVRAVVVPRFDGLFWRDMAVYIFPFIGQAAIHVLSGNRQFVFIGVLIALFSAICRFGMRVLFRPYMIALIAALCVAGVLFQFIRNRGSEGRQDEFLRYVINIKEKDENFLANSYALNSTGMLMFTYYGIQYNTLSAVVEGDVKQGFPFVGTVPILYRRLQGPLGLPSQIELMSETGAVLQQRLGSYGVVWITMFGSFYMEFGWSTLVLYTLLAFAVVIVLGMCGSAYPSIEYLVVGCCVALAFGVHYTITRESAGFFYMSMLVLPGSVFLCVKEPRRLSKSV